MKVLVTGGAGFIGSAVVRRALAGGHRVVTLDAMTYAANPASLVDDPGHVLERADIRDGAAVSVILARHCPDAVLHLAAESHVDRSIDGPGAFVDTNVGGTCTLLEAVRAWWEGRGRPGGFRFLHVSTDEVFGSVVRGRFTEASPYAPASPYAASKAASDHLVRAWGQTYGLPVLVTNCSNNYGPRQYPEKLIPVVILNALAGQEIPVYGTGGNVRDWLHVEDHAEALFAVLERGRIGASYVIGAEAEVTNSDMVGMVCDILQGLRPGPYDRLITHVADRPGHDLRYAIDPARMREELGWRARIPLREGLERTVRWYLENEDWWRGVAGVGERLGLGVAGPATAQAGRTAGARPSGLEPGSGSNSGTDWVRGADR